MFFLIELSGTLGHLSLSIKEVSADGTIMPCLPALPLSQDHTPFPSPLGTDAPT